MAEKSIQILLLALLAAFFGWQLWRVLGRPGPERPPVAPPPGPPAPLPPRAPVAVAPGPVIDVADPVADGLAAIGKADPSFDLNGFLSGARHAFELIVKAFADGDTAALRPLLSDDVYDTFAQAIHDRQAANETVENRILRLDPPEVTRARLDGAAALVELRFQSSQTLVTRGADGQAVEGDPDQPIERTDLWTFSRHIRASDPNWHLVATGTPE